MAYYLSNWDVYVLATLQTDELVCYTVSCIVVCASFISVTLSVYVCSVLLCLLSLHKLCVCILTIFISPEMVVRLGLHIKCQILEFWTPRFFMSGLHTFPFGLDVLVKLYA